MRCLDADDYSESETEVRLASNPVLALAEFFYWTRKLQARFFAGDFASAAEALGKPKCCCGRRHRSWRRVIFASMLPWRILPPGTQFLLKSGGCILRRFATITGSSKYGRSTQQQACCHSEKEAKQP